MGARARLVRARVPIRAEIPARGDAMSPRRAPRAAQLGVTADEYDRLLAAQGGHCALCPNTPKTRRLHVDHDHKTGAVRGLLCYRCNRALPAYLPSEWFARACEYLERYADDNGRIEGRVIDGRTAEMRELRADGMTLREIGERYGITRQAVHKLLRER